MRRPSPALLAGCLALLGVACEKGRTAPSASAAGPAVPAPGARAPAADAPWELLYEREVDGNLDLYVVPAGGGPERRLTDHPKGDMLARYGPDGRRVLFSSERSGDWQIWEMPAEGGEPRRLRTSAAREFQSDPSPDGRQIAFLSNLEGPQGLWLLDRATGAARRLVRHGDASILGNPHWSPDGKAITFSSNWKVGHQIYVVDTVTGEERRISGLTSGGCEPRFSRDGGKVVYVSRGHLRPTSRLVEHDLASGEERALVSWPALNYDPVYSPDGSELAFASNITGDWVIYRQRLSDGRAWRVTFGPGAARSPDYRPQVR